MRKFWLEIICIGHFTHIKDLHTWNLQQAGYYSVRGGLYEVNSSKFKKFKVKKPKRCAKMLVPKINAICKSKDWA